MKNKFFLLLLATAVALSAAFVSCKEDERSTAEVLLNEKAVALFVGDTKELVVESGAANGSVRWTTSNKNAATVDNNGRVTAVALGNATINAITPDGRVGYCKVAVVSLVQSIELVDTAVTVILNEKVQLEVEIQPAEATNKSLTWISSNTAKATVTSEGEVFGVDTGKAVITVISKQDSSKTATCTVTVKWQPVESVAVTAAIDTLSTLLVNKTYPLTYTLLPANASNKKIKWTSGNTNVATVDTATGVVTAKAAGTVRITVTSADNPAKTGYCDVTVVTAYPMLTIDGVTWAASNVAVSIEGGTLRKQMTATPDMASSHYQWGRDSSTAISRWVAQDSNILKSNFGSGPNLRNPCPTIVSGVSGWRVPTAAELQALNALGSTWWAANATRGSGTIAIGNAVAGRFYGSRHASCTMADMKDCIFLPAAGYFDHSTQALEESGTQGVYWSSTVSAYNNVIGNALTFNSNNNNTDNSVNSGSYIDVMFKKSGLSVRCVTNN